MYVDLYANKFDMAFRTRLATAAIVLDTRYEKTDGTYPVKLRITFDRKQKYYTTEKRISLSIEDFNRVYNERIPNKKAHKDLRADLLDAEAKARSIIENIKVFSWGKFETTYFDDRPSTNDVFAYFDKYINKLKSEGRISTAVSYNCAKVSLQKYINDKPLAFSDITPLFLQKYQASRKGSISTIGIYLRSLRALFNAAMEEGLVSQDQYPFGKAYKIPTSVNVKKALTKEQLAAIFNYVPPEGTTENRCRDMWLFSYLCNGINLKDIARLTFNNLTSSDITFIRAKTEKHTRAQKPIVVFRNERINFIINKWGKKTGAGSDYVFDILHRDVTPEEEYKLIQQATKTLNKYMNRICKQLGFDEKVTTYFARHSFATTLKRAGAPLSYISDSLGHSLASTTENYLGSFGNDMREKYSNMLTDF